MAPGTFQATVGARLAVPAVGAGGQGNRPGAAGVPESEGCR
ncbi:hypothetical protein [Streptomyces sp. 8K308]|nr:hypothetical protein [Streptomyces sp. 8K308]